MRGAAMHAAGDGRVGERDKATVRAPLGFAAPTKASRVREAVRS
jgi:hypothetical protein